MAKPKNIVSNFKKETLYLMGGSKYFIAKNEAGEVGLYTKKSDGNYQLIKDGFANIKEAKRWRVLNYRILCKGDEHNDRH